jgi:hypothetical protein
MFNPRKMIAIGFGLVGWCVAQTAFAEPTVQTQTSENGDYSFRFSDEELLGGTMNNVGDLYRGRPPVPRVMLLRPRISLVQEIVKSAENL